MEVIEVRERSTTPIPPQHYRELEREPQFWALVDAGIVALERSRMSRYAVRAGPYVGQAVFGDLLLRVREKIDGALAPLLMFPAQPDVRLLEAESFVARTDLIIRALIDKYLELLGGYLRFGRLKVYEKTLQRSALPRGKVAVARTMRRWAAGRRDQVVYTVDGLSPRVLLNQLIGFSLHLIDPMIARADDAERRKRVRTAALLFEDTGWEALTRTPPAWINDAYTAAGYAISPLAGLASLARLFALHFGAATSASEERVKYSWFVNLETLFEDCVRESAADAASSRRLRVTDWRAARRFIFDHEQRYRAEPDLVVWDDRGPIALLDAKYKDPEIVPANSDVYQLIAHAQAWGVSRTGLVYPATEDTVKQLGDGPHGVAVYALTLNVLDPMKGGAAAVEFAAAGVRTEIAAPVE